jgi:DNA-directed RNA polymerase subunit N (RpoN/RPB10)
VQYTSALLAGVKCSIMMNEYVFDIEEIKDIADYFEELGLNRYDWDEYEYISYGETVSTTPYCYPDNKTIRLWSDKWCMNNEKYRNTQKDKAFISLQEHIGDSLP